MRSLSPEEAELWARVTATIKPLSRVSKSSQERGGEPAKPVEGPINDRIDDAYRMKYRGSPYLGAMIGARARSASVKIMPRETNA